MAIIKYIDNQLIDKTSAHFESFKRPKCVHKFYRIDIQFVTKLPAPGLQLCSLISRESEPVCREFPQNYLVSSGQCP